MRIVHYPHPSPCPSRSIPTTRETLERDLQGILDADIRDGEGLLLAIVRGGTLTWL